MRKLVVIGNVNVDLILGPTAPWPQPGTEIIVDHDELRVGGSAGNTALAWAGMGVDHVIAANIGSDRFGDWLRESFGPRAARWPVRPENTTVSVGITHPDGERTFFTSRGHLPHFALADVHAVIDGAALDGGIALLCGSFLTDRLVDDYDALFDWADAHGIATALDTGWPLAGWTEENRSRARRWLSRSRIALLNEVETTSLAGLSDPLAAGEALRRLMPEGAIVVVKRGPDGATGIGPDGSVCHVPAPAIAVVDTIGAGDVFNAGFLAALAEGRDLAEALAAGVATASTAVSTHPRRYGPAPETKDAR